jgi:hypothetical protein
MLPMGVESETLKSLGSIGELLAGVAASMAIPFAYRQIRNQRALAREARVYAYVDRMNDVALLPLIAEARDFWEYGRDNGTAQGMVRWTDMGRLARHRVVQPMNLLEEVGDQYMTGFLVRDLVKRLFATAAVGYYEEAEWFIDETRAVRGTAAIYDQWKAMVDDFQT